MGAPSKLGLLLIGDSVRELWTLAKDLGSRFTPVIALSAAEAREALVGRRDIAVAVAGGGRAEVDPVALLLEVRAASPGVSLVLVADDRELPAAVAAAAKHDLFRVLCRPLDREQWLATLDAGAAAYARRDERRRWIDDTVRPLALSLSEALSLSNPGLFSRTLRVRQKVQQASRRCGFEDAWVADVAALLSDLGMLSLPADVAEKLNHGELLSAADQAVAEEVRERSAKSIAHIPELAPVAEALRRYREPASPSVPLASRILRAATDLDAFEASGLPTRVAAAKLRARPQIYDPAVVSLIDDGRPLVVTKVKISGLKPGMVLSEDLRTASGMLVAARGHVISESLLDRVRTFGKKQPLRQPVEICASPDACAEPEPSRQAS